LGTLVEKLIPLLDEWRWSNTMDKLISWLKQTSLQIWQGFLQNIGWALFLFILSGGYILAVKTVKQFQKSVRNIPSDWIILPFVFFSVVLLLIIHKQKGRLKHIEKHTPPESEKGHLITHYGVWWKIYDESLYIEDFPYCPCCDHKKKLVQTEWYPNEIYKCPSTGVEVKLYDEVPRKRKQILNSLYNSYFTGGEKEFEMFLFQSFERKRTLNPDKKDREILEEMFTKSGLKNIPDAEREKILGRFENYSDVFSFLVDNFQHYRRYLKKE